MPEGGRDFAEFPFLSISDSHTSHILVPCLSFPSSPRGISSPASVPAHAGVPQKAAQSTCNLCQKESAKSLFSTTNLRFSPSKRHKQPLFPPPSTIHHLHFFFPATCLIFLLNKGEPHTSCHEVFESKTQCPADMGRGMEHPHMQGASEH